MPIDVTYNTKNMGGGIIVETLEVKLRTADGKKHTIINDDKRGSLTFTAADGKLEAKDVDGNIIDITDSLSNGILKGNLDMLNKSETFDNPANDVKGIGYYQKTFDMFVNEFATMMNRLNSTTTPPTAPDKPLFVTNDGNTTGFTASNIKISDDWINGNVKITLSKDPDAGSTDYSNVLKMINALSSDEITFEIPHPDGSGGKKQIFKGTFFECYDNIQNTQALERQAAASLLKNHQTVADQVANSRESVSGVNMDEEVMDLMRFSQSYNAASRLMTTMDELLERLIVNTGVVGR